MLPVLAICQGDAASLVAGSRGVEPTSEAGTSKVCSPLLVSALEELHIRQGKLCRPPADKDGGKELQFAAVAKLPGLAHGPSWGPNDDLEMVGLGSRIRYYCAFKSFGSSSH
mmetsp:Transcript_53897/g.118029  ORF Transcript_53897/g.118029 Transcript_53897/m.118029 type:complete len:112 (-) Transcript_53897:337-672(-)